MSGQHSYASYQNHESIENCEWLRPLSETAYKQVNSMYAFDKDSLNTLISNIETSARARNVCIYDMRVDTWGEMMRRRVSCEPILRLVFECFKVMNNYDITLMEVLSENPKLMYKAMEQGDIRLYYEQYPNAMNAPR